MLDNRFTQGAQNALMLTFAAARRLGHSYIGSEHLLLGLYANRSGAAYRALAAFGLTEARLQEAVSAAVGAERKNPATAPCLTAEAARIIENSSALATGAGSAAVDSEHILLALLKETSCGGVRVLNACGVDVAQLYGSLLTQRAPAQGHASAAGGAKPKGKAGELKLTLQFGVDLTQKAREGAFDPVIGREKETRRVMEILTRRQKSNPVLLGEAGVGKTAIAEYLAQKIAGGRVPLPLMHKRLVALELSSVIAGTKYRGEFEERLRSIVEELKAAGDVIVFIDEMHMLAGAGAAEGAIDAANILKPALARAGFQMIGATTPAEYKKYIEKDSALERRFQPVKVDEPTKEQTEEILKGLRPKYEAHHNVKLGDDALHAAVELSARYYTERYFPDKAVDLMDESAAYVRAELRHAVTARDVAAVVGRTTGVAVGLLAEPEKQRLEKLESVLGRRVIGQDKAVGAVSRAVRRGRVLGDQLTRPQGAFLLAGPSGVGKTELARALAEALFGDKKALIRFDMSEYMESHAVSKLLGSPPGYVGYGEGGQLTEAVRRSPYSVVLFDEAEKAHPDVLNILLQLLEDGFLTDAEGKRVDFKSTIIILTTNVGLAQMALNHRAGFGRRQDDGSLQADVEAELKRSFRPELLNRMDDILVFRPLGNKELREIAHKLLEEEAALLRFRGVTLRWDYSALGALCAGEEDKAYGARPLRRRIQREVEDKAVDYILSGQAGQGDVLHLTADGDKPVLRLPAAQAQSAINL